MASKDERLIDRDPDAEPDESVSEPFYKSATFILVLKVSLCVGILSSLITGMILTNMRLSKLETNVTDTLFNVEQLTLQQGVVVTNLKSLTKEHQILVTNVSTLDLESSKGDLTTALHILDTQSANIDKQLAVTRNGLISLARMVKGSRVWQEDYRAQYKALFDSNQSLKAEIKSLRGIVKKEPTEARFIEMDF
jgi:cell division protein FtsB